MPRACFTLQVDPAQVEDYRAAHAAVWPDMLAALAESGWHDYRLFLRHDGLLVGTVETDDLGAAQEAMEGRYVNARWQEAMARFFPSLAGATPDASFVELEEIFHLEEQLARSRPPAPSS